MAKIHSEVTLSQIAERLDAVIALLLPPVAATEGLKKQILVLCDGAHTAEEIAEITKRKSGHIAKELSALRSEGKMVSIKRDGKIVYARLRTT